MSTATVQNRPAGTPATLPAARGVSFLRALHAEWIKFTTLRSTWILLATTVVVMVGIGLLAGSVMGSGLGEGGAGGRGAAAVGLDPKGLYMVTPGGIDFGQ